MCEFLFGWDAIIFGRNNVNNGEWRMEKKTCRKGNKTRIVDYYESLNLHSKSTKLNMDYDALKTVHPKIK